jgi:2-dehydro-3-deoxygluconokinase
VSDDLSPVATRRTEEPCMREAATHRAGTFASSRPVVCLGESMVMLVPEARGRLVDGHTFTAAVGGAESNVACYLARLGVPVAWLSRVGDDAFGSLVLDTLAEAGVDTSRVEVDPTRLTGCYVKELDGGATRVRYYREGSAASAMGPGLVGSVGLGGASVLHLSGITAALSPSCHALMETLSSAPRGGSLLSFDVNWRPALWGTGEGGEVTGRLARRADLVFVGRDEAHTLWHVDDPEEIADHLGHPPTLVVKDAEHGATVVDHTGTTWVPSLPVEVVEPVGAGDAFAAGFIAGTLADLPNRQRLRFGHALAASALSTRHDLGTLPEPDALSALVHADDAGWGLRA